MAVPGRRNGLLDEEDNGEDNALFEEDGVEIDLESDIPQHLRQLAAAAQIGDVEALRLALGSSAFTFLVFWRSIDLFVV